MPFDICSLCVFGVLIVTRTVSAVPDKMHPDESDAE